MTRLLRLDLRALAGIPLTLLLAGCMVGPGYERPELTAPENHRTLTTTAEAESLADLPWWEVFQDPVLHELVNEALVNNHDLRIAAARVEEARARAGVAKSYVWPELNLTAGYGLNEASLTTEPPQATSGDRRYENLNASFVLSWEIDLFGRLRRQNESAMAVFLATEEARQGVVLTLVGDVARAYFALRALDLQLEIARRTLELNDGTVTFYRDRLEGGISNKLEVNQAIATRARTAAAIPELERQIAVQENFLSFLVGRNPGPIARGTALTDQYLPPVVPAGLPSALLDRRPDVRQAEQLLVSANADVGAARALFYPTISLTGLFGGASSDLTNLTDRSSQVWSIGAGLFQPLFQAGRIRRNHEAAQAAFDQALSQYAKTAQNAYREVADSLVAIDKYALVRFEQETAVVALQEASELSRSRYDLGLSTYLEVLIADEQLFAAEVALAETRFAQLDAVVQLYRALGGGWQQPEPEAPPAE
ncbi:MAG: efflux system, outer rane lipoprotein, NodT family [Acidobacteria bacterium]|nr:efflux system, outer rane lipoprotein, NodT family [Acidobacteriota bacterium]